MKKVDKLWNVKSKLPETQAFKDTCYITKKSCTDVETIQNNLIFERPVTFENLKPKKIVNCKCVNSSVPERIWIDISICNYVKIVTVIVLYDNNVNFRDMYSVY